MTSLPLVRVRLKHTDADTFVQRFSPNVTRGGIFLASRDPRPVGALVRFEVTLVHGAVMMAGEGRVAWVKPYDPAEPGRAHGMGVQFTELDSASMPMFERLLARKEGGAGKEAAPAAAGKVAAPMRSALPSGAVIAPLITSGSAERRITEGNLGEFDALEDTALRRALDRARAIGPGPDRVEELLTAAEPGPAVSLEEALADLPRYFVRGRGSGLFRVPPEMRGEPGAPPAATGPAAPAPVLASPPPLPPDVAVETAPASAVPQAVAEEPTRPLEPGDAEEIGPDEQALPVPAQAAPVNGVPPDGR